MSIIWARRSPGFLAPCSGPFSLIVALHCVACLLSSRGYAKSCRPQRGHRSTRFLGALRFPLGLAAAGGRLPTDAVLGALALQLSRGLGLFWWAVGLL